MQTNTLEVEEIKFEIVPESLGLEVEAKKSLELAFATPFEKAREWITKANEITDPKEARAARLEIVKIRTSGAKIHEQLKKGILIQGRAIDGAKNILIATLHPLEEKLEGIEKAAERAEAERIQALHEQRTLALAQFDYVAVGVTLGTMTEENFTKLLQDAEDIQAVRKERERKAEEERLAKLKAEQEERDRIVAENARLKKEAEEREAAAEIERQKAEAARVEAEKAAQAEREQDAKDREAIEAKTKAEREAAEKKAKAEREAAEAQRREAEAAAKKEQDKLAAQATEAKAAQQKAEADAQKLRNEAVKREQDAAAAKAKAARAPDKEKAMAFAANVRSWKLGNMKTPEGNAVAAEIERKIINFAKWIEEQAAVL